MKEALFVCQSEYRSSGFAQQSESPENDSYILLFSVPLDYTAKSSKRSFCSQAAKENPLKIMSV